MILETSFEGLCDRSISASEVEKLNHLHGIEAIVVPYTEDPQPLVHSPRCPVICIKNNDGIVPPHIDVIVSNQAELGLVIDGIQQSPVASALLVQLLRHNEKSSLGDAVFAESLTYSTLQHGQEYEAWLVNHERRDQAAPQSEPAILISREGDILQLTLNRPKKRNAWSTEMRDAMTEAMHLLDTDSSLVGLTINAHGPSFSAGGDLDEFGLARDAALAHLTRSIRNPALLVDKHQSKITAHLHGACVGAGIEIPAFASRVTAKEASFFLLPEVAFGLIPGAGGTASILRRIGRQRLGWMAIGGQRIDSHTALDWGLIDEIDSS